MEFSEEKAKDIISQFGLDENTLKVWRTRGAIPDRYFREGFELKPKAEGVVAEGEKDEQAIRDIRRIFGYGKLNVSAVGRLVGADDYRFVGIISKGVTPTREEILSIKKAIQSIRIEAIRILSGLNQFRVSTVSQNQLKAFLSRNEVVASVLIGDKAISAKVRKWQSRLREYPEEHNREIAQAIGVFITETNML